MILAGSAEVEELRREVPQAGAWAAGLLASGRRPCLLPTPALAGLQLRPQAQGPVY